MQGSSLTQRNDRIPEGKILHGNLQLACLGSGSIHPNPPSILYCRRPNLATLSQDLNGDFKKLNGFWSVGPGTQMHLFFPRCLYDLHPLPERIPACFLVVWDSMRLNSRALPNSVLVWRMSCASQTGINDSERISPLKEKFVPTSTCRRLRRRCE
jgi:hypothetical protein